jgi:hypothetical protein
MGQVHVTLTYDEEHLEAIIKHVKEHRYPSIQSYLNRVLNTVLVDLTEQMRQEEMRELFEKRLSNTRKSWPGELGPRYPLLSKLKRHDD